MKDRRFPVTRWNKNRKEKDYQMINADLSTLTENQNKIIEIIEEMSKLLQASNDRYVMLLDTIHEICPGLGVIEEISEDDEERRMLLRKYMNTAVDSDDQDIIFDWIMKQDS